MGLRGFIEQMPEDATGIEFDLIHVERGENAAGQPTAKVTQDITVAVKGRDVLLLQWVVGTGCTTERVTAHLRQKNPASVKVCAMLDDVALRTTPVTVDYRVVEFERRAVIGVAKGEGFTFPCIAI
jgi:hypoxanthine phosphoribosyltransferase